MVEVSTVLFLVASDMSTNPAQRALCYPQQSPLFSDISIRSHRIFLTGRPVIHSLYFIFLIREHLTSVFLVTRIPGMPTLGECIIRFLNGFERLYQALPLLWNIPTIRG